MHHMRSDMMACESGSDPEVSEVVVAGGTFRQSSANQLHLWAGETENWRLRRRWRMIECCAK